MFTISQINPVASDLLTLTKSSLASGSIPISLIMVAKLLVTGYWLLVAGCWLHGAEFLLDFVCASGKSSALLH